MSRSVSVGLLREEGVAVRKDLIGDFFFLIQRVLLLSRSLRGSDLHLEKIPLAVIRKMV